MKKLFLILCCICLPIYATESETLPKQKIPRKVQTFYIEHTSTKKENPNAKIYYVKDWNGYKVYTIINLARKYPPGVVPVIGGPVYILHNRKETRFAKGCENEELWSNGAFKCHGQQHH